MSDPGSHAALDIDAIRASVPIQYPMLMIDRVTSRSPEGCTVVKNLTITEPCFVGHFPKRAIFPGSMLVETMAQAGFFIGPPAGAAPESAPDLSGATDVFLLSVEVKFLKPAVPGDRIVIDARLVSDAGRIRRFRATASVEGETVAKGTFVVMLGSAL
jgi:3-hydroxyacyl-[acyl-carrier-protein] dehydratase